MSTEIIGDCLNCSMGKANTKLAIALRLEHENLNQVLKRVKEFNNPDVERDSNFCCPEGRQAAYCTREHDCIECWRLALEVKQCG